MYIRSGSTFGEVLGAAGGDLAVDDLAHPADHVERERGRAGAVVLEPAGVEDDREAAHRLVARGDRARAGGHHLDEAEPRRRRVARECV